MMKKILYSLLTLVLGLVLSSSGCSTTIDPFDPVIYDEGVTINGVTWATRNVGEFRRFANKAEDYGMYYQWNHKVAWAATGSVSGYDTNPLSGSAWTTANDPCPEGWRVPKKAEFESLISAAVTKTWNAFAGVDGLYFGTASSLYQLFLPAAGARRFNTNTLDLAGLYGDYWANELESSGHGYSIHFGPTGVSMSAADNTWGYPVRCVKK